MDQKAVTELQSTLSAIAEQYRQQMDALAEDFAKMLQQGQQQMQKFASFHRELADALHEILPKIESGCERLGKLGWSLPMNLSPGELAWFAGHSNSDEEIEHFMLDYFTRENGRYFLALKSDVLRSDNLIGWRALLEQCFAAYERGHYLVPIPALLSVIEGAVAQQAGKLNVAQVDPRTFAAELESGAPAGGMELLVWRSARLVLGKLFAWSYFGGPHPGELNRHWALHGRDQTQWSRTDALRLFNLLATIS